MVRFWWPQAGKDVHAYVQSCRGCQIAAPVQEYKTNLMKPTSRLFDVFSIDFTSSLSNTTSENRFMMLAVEHLTS